nr:MAG: hypothetical protein [Microviridae sp.]
MRNIQKPCNGSIRCNESTTGERIESKIKRALENQEPIDESVDLIFTERRDGVKHEYNPRGDKWEEAVEAIGQKTKSQLTQRKEILEKKKQKEEPKNDPTQ